jgi:hypothetical protein
MTVRILPRTHPGDRDLGAIAITKPYKFIGFGAIAITKPCKFIGIGDAQLGDDGSGPIAEITKPDIKHRYSLGYHSPAWRSPDRRNQEKEIARPCLPNQAAWYLPDLQDEHDTVVC